MKLFLKLKFVNADAYSQHALHVPVENVPVLQHKEIQLTNLDATLVSVMEINEIPLSEFQMEATNKRKIAKQGISRSNHSKSSIIKEVFLEILQNSQENTCARASFLTKFQV